MSFIKSIADAANHVKHAVIPKKKPEQKTIEGKTTAVAQVNFLELSETETSNKGSIRSRQSRSMLTMPSESSESSKKTSSKDASSHSNETSNNVLPSGGESADDAASCQEEDSTSSREIGFYCDCNPDDSSLSFEGVVKHVQEILEAESELQKSCIHAFASRFNEGFESDRDYKDQELAGAYRKRQAQISNELDISVTKMEKLPAHHSEKYLTQAFKTGESIVDICVEVMEKKGDYFSPKLCPRAIASHVVVFLRNGLTMRQSTNQEHAGEFNSYEEQDTFDELKKMGYLGVTSFEAEVYYTIGRLPKR